MPDEPQPVKVPEAWWHHDPIQGVMVGPFGKVHMVQYRDAEGRMQSEGHYNRGAALDMALHLSKGRPGRRAKAWENEAKKDAPLRVWAA